MPRQFLLKILIAAIIFSTPAVSAHAFWMWTPESNKWVNPKYSVKDTPQDQLALAMELYNSKEYKKAINEFNKLINHYPKAREAAEAQYFIGRSLKDQDELYQAFK